MDVTAALKTVKVDRTVGPVSQAVEGRRHGAPEAKVVFVCVHIYTYKYTHIYIYMCMYMDMCMGIHMSRNNRVKE